MKSLQWLARIFLSMLSKKSSISRSPTKHPSFLQAAALDQWHSDGSLIFCKQMNTWKVFINCRLIIIHYCPLHYLVLNWWKRKWSIFSGFFSYEKSEIRFGAYLRVTSSLWSSVIYLSLNASNSFMLILSIPLALPFLNCQPGSYESSLVKIAGFSTFLLRSD